ncbi:MAG: SEC-C domain-containing protein [Chloroflexi bacterium]|nr:SEC-C domain-containing protein [Chloroflexota bacterium]
MNSVARAKPDFIWSLPDLLKFLEHPSDRVKEWAASLVLTLYPESAGQAIQTLPESSSQFAYSLLDDLKDLPFPEAGAEPLRKFLENQKGNVNHAKTLAAALLLREGHELPEGVEEGISLENALAYFPKSDQGFARLLQWYIEGREMDGLLTHAIAQGCNAEDLFDSWEYGRGMRGVVKDLEKSLRVSLPAVHKVKGRGHAMRLLRDALDATAQSLGLVRSGFPVIAAQLDRDRARIAATLKAAEGREAEGEQALSDEIEMLLACALAVGRDAACMKSLLAEPLGIGDLWRGLVMRPWSGREIDPGLAASLERQTAQSPLPSLREALKVPWAYFAYPYFYLEANSVPGRHQLLREASDRKFGDNIGDDVWDLLFQISREPVAMESLLDDWRRIPPPSLDLSILRNYPTEGVVQFLLDTFEEYMSQPNSSFMLEAMEEVASQRFLEPLLREWRPGEVVLSRVVAFLAELHGVKDDVTVRKAISEAKENRFLDRIESPDELERILREKPISVPLRCTVCKRTYSYELKRAFVGNRPGDTIIGQVIQCKGCGSLESYEITKETETSLSFAMLRAMIATDSGDDGEPVDNPFVRGPSKLTAAGKTFNSGPEAYRYLLSRIETEPDDAALQRRMGNYLRNGSRPDLAVPYFREALRLDPREGESLYGLADCLIELERPWEAIPHAETLLGLAREEMDEEDARDAFAGLLQLNIGIQEKTGKQLDIFPTRKAQELGKTAASAEGGHFELIDLELDDPDDFEAAYEVFRHGSLPKGMARRRRSVAPEPALGPFEPQTPVRVTKTGRNELCPCGSGKKYKRCCGR